MCIGISLPPNPARPCLLCAKEVWQGVASVHVPCLRQQILPPSGVGVLPEPGSDGDVRHDKGLCEPMGLCVGREQGRSGQGLLTKNHLRIAGVPSL